MSDTLEVFGTEHTNVAGFKATDDNDNIKTYIRPQGAKSITANGNNIDVAAYATANVNVSGGGDNVFLVTLSWDDDFLPEDAEEPGAWVPDCTFAEIEAAYNAGKTITVDASAESKVADGWYYDDEEWPVLVYAVYGIMGADWKMYNYELYEDALVLHEIVEFIEPWFDSPSRTYTPSEQVQTETITYDPDYNNGIEEVNVTVNAIPSNYVGSGVTRRSSSDLSASGATVSVPAGYYESAASKSVASGTEGTPTATKGSVSNHAVSVTPSVTNTSGYISGGTINGTSVSVAASELVSGTYTVDSSGTKDVTNYASASVPAGTAGTPTASKGTVSNHSVTVTPSVTNTTGFITGSTKTGTGVSVSASELVSGSETKTANGTYDVTNLASLVVNVSGGSSKALYKYDGLASRTANSYGATNAKVTVTKAGTYNISYVAIRGSSSGTMGTNLHIGSSSGTNQQTWNNGTYGQYVHLTNQQISANTDVTIYATSGNTSRTIYAGMLIVEEV